MKAIKIIYQGNSVILDEEEFIKREAHYKEIENELDESRTIIKKYEDGDWLTPKDFMDKYNIKKSTFYNHLKKGVYITKKFEDCHRVLG